VADQIDISVGRRRWVIVTEGGRGRFGGYGFYLSNGELGIGRGKPVFLYNLFDFQRTVWAGPERKPGKHAVEFDFRFEGNGFGKGSMGTLTVDGTQADQKRIEHTVPFIFQWDETFDVGMDTGTPVAFLEYRYDPPFAFTGTLSELTFNQMFECGMIL
jgi:hypothetical protein